MWSNILSFLDDQYAVALLLAWVIPLVFVVYKFFKNTWYIRHKLKQNDSSVLKRNLGMPVFMGITIGLFFGLVAFYYPIRYSEAVVQDSSEFIKVIKTLLYSIHSSIRTFVIGMSFTEVHTTLGNSLDTGSFVYRAYLVHAAIMCILAPSLTAVGLLSFFKDLLSTLRLTLSPKRHVYYFSELNYRSLSLAINILTEDRPIRNGGILKPLIVFFDVNEADKSAGANLVQQAKRLNAICFQKDISEANLKDGIVSFIIPTVRKFYFLSENEDKNVKQAITLINICSLRKRMNNENTEFYVFATTEESELLLDAVNKGSMKERRVNENRNLVLSTIRDEPIFTCETPDANGIKHIDVLVVGGGSYGTELIKALCWCGQIPGYYMHIHVIDKDKNPEERFKALAPELLAYRGGKEENGPCYDISFYPDIDVYSYKFIETIDKIEDINLAFVTLGEDQININASIILRRELLRRFEKLGDGQNHKVKIYSVVYSNLKNDILTKGDDKNRVDINNQKDTRCTIHYIGDLNTRYSIPIIEQTDLEDAALMVHFGWTNLTRAEFDRKKAENKKQQDAWKRKEKKYNKQLKVLAKAKRFLEKWLERLGVTPMLIEDQSDKSEEQSVKKAKNPIEALIERIDAHTTAINEEINVQKEKFKPINFNSSEYFRRSSIAGAVYKIILNKLGIDLDQYDKDYEHIRWMAYMRAEGYIKGVRDAASGKDLIAKTHPTIDATKTDKKKKTEKADESANDVKNE